MTIQAIEKGYRCIFDGCKYITKDESRMKKHYGIKGKHKILVKKWIDEYVQNSYYCYIALEKVNKK